jgi:hypothetical protein
MNDVSNVARQLILDTADEEPALWKLRWGPELVGGVGRRQLYPPLTIQQVRPALEALLREGHVLLYDATNPASPVSLRDALARIADDRNWFPSAVRGHRPAYLVILTESGGAEYRSLSAA